MLARCLGCEGLQFLPLSFRKASAECGPNEGLHLLSRIVSCVGCIIRFDIKCFFRFLFTSVCVGLSLRRPRSLSSGGLYVRSCMFASRITIPSYARLCQSAAEGTFLASSYSGETGIANAWNSIQRLIKMDLYRTRNCGCNQCPPLEKTRGVEFRAGQSSTIPFRTDNKKHNWYLGD